MEVQNYPNYLIYEDGRIFSKISNRFLKATMSTYGYYQVGVSKNGVRKQFLIHRLISIHYIPNTNPNNLKFINHKNCNKADNSIDNLEWCTNLYNTQSKNKNGNVGCVCFRTDCRTKRYNARIRINRVLHQKCFKTDEEAREWLVEISNS